MFYSLLAKDIAEWIEHSNSKMMLQGIDEAVH